MLGSNFQVNKRIVPIESYRTLPSLMPELWSNEKLDVRPETNTEQEINIIPKCTNSNPVVTENENPHEPTITKGLDVNKASFYLPKQLQ